MFHCETLLNMSVFRTFLQSHNKSYIAGTKEVECRLVFAEQDKPNQSNVWSQMKRFISTARVPYIPLTNKRNECTSFNISYL